MIVDFLMKTVVTVQVIDGFTIKWVHDARETAAYLTLMTRYLQSYYQVQCNMSGVL